jgi:hypothetical protein
MSVQANGAASKPRGVLGSFVSSLALRVVGSSALTADDLAPALVDMKVRGAGASVNVALRACSPLHMTVSSLSCAASSSLSCAHLCPVPALFCQVA